MKLKARPGSSRKRLLVEREEKARKCVVIGSRNCSVSRFIKSFQNCLESSQLENEGTLRLNETTFVFWEGISKLKKSSLKQYLAYHGTQILFFLINEADILVREGGRREGHLNSEIRKLIFMFQESFVEISGLINLCILEYLHFNIVIVIHIRKFLFDISFIKMHQF